MSRRWLVDPFQIELGLLPIEAQTGLQTVTVTPALARPSFPALTLVPGDVTVTVTPAVARPAFPALTLVPGEVTVTVTPAVARPAFPDFTLVAEGGAQTITVTPAAARPAFPTVTLVPGDVTITVTPAVARPAFPDFTLVAEGGAQTVTVTPAVARPAFPALTLVPGDVTITVTPAVARPAFPTVTLVPGGGAAFPEVRARLKLLMTEAPRWVINPTVAPRWIFVLEGQKGETMETMEFKRGDLKRPIAGQVVPDVDGTGCSVFLTMRSSVSKAKVIDRVQGVVTQANPLALRYDWQAGQTDVAGLYEYEIEILFADGKSVRVPSKGYYPLVIHERL
jgi:hypothetical protein